MGNTALKYTIQMHNSLEHKKLAPACEKPGIPEILRLPREMKLNYICLKT